VHAPGQWRREAELSNPDAEHVREIKARFETTLHVCDAELQVVLVSTASQCVLIP
jgi:hypothetical protein